MCGILALLRTDRAAIASTRPLVRATQRVRHRGPDDEGYLLWEPGEEPRVLAGPDTAAPTHAALALPSLPDAAPWRVGLGHRRLSIVDLSPAGHQPKVHRATGLAVVYNGEIYNHVELRRELERVGHRFESHSDTEVLLAAWAEWGAGCLHRLNGMFAFVLLDPRQGGTLHAVRDRFGVKPLYWARVGDLLAFASELKQIRALPGYGARIDERAARDYLVAGLLDHSDRTLDAGIRQLRGGERAVVRLDRADAPVEISRWYELAPARFRGTDRDAAAAFRELLADSVRLRLRADVPIGSCLSGGLDSSAIVCLARETLETQGEHAGQVTVTARFADPRFDEWRYARLVLERAHARPVEVWPSFEQLRAELDTLLWHMDEPVGSTSMFSQWCVFGAAAEAGLKVMLDGQGSDEQLAGYRGNETTLMTGLLRRVELASLLAESLAFRRAHGVVPVAQLVLAARNAMPWTDALLPERVRVVPAAPTWLRADAPSLVDPAPPRDLADSLRRQTLAMSLPSLLHYEDRNSMARSIEARVPFLDYRLVEFVLGLPDRLKLHRGLTKVVMREAMRGVLPEEIRDRRDKMGFVTPEQVWLTQTAPDWVREEVDLAIERAPELLVAEPLRREVDDVLSGRSPYSALPWRVLCFGRWLAATGRAPMGADPEEAACAPEAARGA
jgi:asparagine synthase (glutamine-hydrolysing)